MAVNGIELINLMRENASLDYQDRIPEASKTTLSLIGDILLGTGNDALRDEFTGLLEKIAITIFQNRAYNNPLKVLKKGMLPLGATIEEVAIELAKSKDFDPNGANNMARVIPNTINYYHNNCFRNTYSASISRTQIRKAFTSEGNLNRFITETINSLYNGYEVDDFIIMKNAYGQEVLNAYQVECAKPIDETTSKKFVKELKKMCYALTFPNTKFNPIGLATWTPREKQVLLITYDVLSEISVEVLASAFNQSEVDYMTRVIVVDDFGNENEAFKDISNLDYSTYAMLVDEDGALFYDLEIYTDRDHNGKGSFDTIHLQVGGNYAISMCRNLVAFTPTKAVEIETPSNVWGVGYYLSFEKYNKNFLTTSFNDENYIVLYRDGELIKSGTAQITYTYKDGTTETASSVISSDGSVNNPEPSSTTKTWVDVSKITITSIS